MRNNLRCFVLFAIFASSLTIAQESKPLEVSISSIRSELKKNAIDFGIRYVKSLDSLFKEQDLLISGKRSLLQITPEFNVQSGTEDAFSSIDIKLSGLLMFFKTTTVAEQITPCTKCFMHLMPISLGIESDNTFTNINGIFEVGYVPWYQSPMLEDIPKWIKATRVGLFMQAGYKFNTSTDDTLIGGQMNESEEEKDKSIFRAKGSFRIDSKSLFEINGIGVGLVGGADGWYDFVNQEIYYSLNGVARFYITKGLDKHFDFKYQKGSGAPNFNEGDQFGVGLTIAF